MEPRRYRLKNGEKISLDRYEVVGRKTDYIIDKENIYNDKPIIIVQEKEDFEGTNLEGIIVNSEITINRCHVYKDSLEKANLLSEKDAIKIIKKYHSTESYPGRRH